MARALTISIPAVAVLIVTGCGTSAAPEELTDNWLSSAISLVPADYGTGYLFFGNYLEARNVADAGEFMGVRTLRGDVPAPISPSTGKPPWVGEVSRVMPWTYSLMPPLYVRLRTYATKVYGTTGLDFFLLDEMVGADSVDHNTFTFLAVKSGAVDYGGLPDTLEDMGYYSSSRDGLPYYHWYVDDLNKAPGRLDEHPIVSIMIPTLEMGAVAVLGDQLIISRRVDHLLEVLDVHRGLG